MLTTPIYINGIMTSIIFELGRELVNEVQAGIKAHQDIKEGKEVERRQDKWGDPLAPKTVYSVVRGVEETLGMGKSNNDKGRVKEPNKEAISERELASSLLPMRVAETVSRLASLSTSGVSGAEHIIRPRLMVTSTADRMTSLSTAFCPSSPLSPSHSRL